MANVNSQTGAINKLEKSYQKIKDEYYELRKKQSQNELVDEETINKLRNQIKQFTNKFMSDVQKLDSVNENVYNKGLKIIRKMEYLVMDLTVKNSRVDKNQSDTEVRLTNLIDCINNDYDSIKAKNVDEEDLLDIILKELERCLDKYKNGNVDDDDTKELMDYVIEELDRTFLYNISEDMNKRQASKSNVNKQQQNKNNQNDVALILETLISYMEEDYDLIKSRNVDDEGLLEILLKGSKDCLTNYNAKKITDKDVIDLVKFVVEELKNSFNYDVEEKANKQVSDEKRQQNNSNHTNSSNNSQTNQETNNRTKKTNNSNNNNKQKNDEIRKRYKVVNARRSGLALGGLALGILGVRQIWDKLSLIKNWGIDCVSVEQLGVTAGLLLLGGTLELLAFFYRDKKLIKMTMEKAKDKSENNNKEENKGRRSKR